MFPGFVRLLLVALEHRALLAQALDLGVAVSERAAVGGGVGVTATRQSLRGALYRQVVAGELHRQAHAHRPTGATPRGHGPRPGRTAFLLYRGSISHSRNQP